MSHLCRAKQPGIQDLLNAINKYFIEAGIDEEDPTDVRKAKLVTLLFMTEHKFARDDIKTILSLLNQEQIA